MILAGRSAKALLETVWATALGDSGYTYAIHDFSGECSHTEIARIVDAARAMKAATIIGAGGGKVLDSARAAAADLGLPSSIAPLWHRAMLPAARFR